VGGAKARAAVKADDYLVGARVTFNRLAERAGPRLGPGYSLADAWGPKAHPQAAPAVFQGEAKVGDTYVHQVARIAVCALQVFDDSGTADKVGVPPEDILWRARTVSSVRSELLSSPH
jgi:hypothetical protein